MQPVPHDCIVCRSLVKVCITPFDPSRHDRMATKAYAFARLPRSISYEADLILTRYLFGVWVSGVLLTGCSRGSVLPNPAPALSSVRLTSEGYVYVSNRTEQGTSQLLVYRAGINATRPLRTVARGLVDGGLAVDPSGNVYVANGSGGNVLEFAPGAPRCSKPTRSDSIIRLMWRSPIERCTLPIKETQKMDTSNKFWSMRPATARH